MTLMIIQLLIVLLALYVGSRYGSLALGAISGIGLAILVLGFGLQPGKPHCRPQGAVGLHLRRHKHCWKIDHFLTLVTALLPLPAMLLGAYVG